MLQLHEEKLAYFSCGIVLRTLNPIGLCESVAVKKLLLNEKVED